MLTENSNLSIDIHNCSFLENQSKYQCSCISFLGENFTITGKHFLFNDPSYIVTFKESFFKKNKGLISDATIQAFDIMQQNGVTFSYVEEIVPEVGGPLNIRAYSTIIKDCYFIESNGNLGGAIYLGKQQNIIDNQLFLMERSIFYNNTGGQSGCVEFALDLEFFTGLVNQSYFNFNRAGCKPLNNSVHL